MRGRFRVDVRQVLQQEFYKIPPSLSPLKGGFRAPLRGLFKGWCTSGALKNSLKVI